MYTKPITTGLLLAALSLPAFAEGDAERGAKIFKKCKACHMVGDGAKNRVGPNLTGVVGSVYGSNETFKYSKAMTAKHEEGAVWTAENLTAFLTKPKAAVPKTKMSFPGLKKAQDIEDVIAYLSSF